MKVVKCKVKTNARKNSIKQKDDVFIVELRAKPVKGQANKELLKFLKKELLKTPCVFGPQNATRFAGGKNVEIVRGHTSHKKLIKIE